MDTPLGSEEPAAEPIDRCRSVSGVKLEAPAAFGVELRFFLKDQIRSQQHIPIRRLRFL